MVTMGCDGGIAFGSNAPGGGRAGANPIGALDIAGIEGLSLLITVLHGAPGGTTGGVGGRMGDKDRAEAAGAVPGGGSREIGMDVGLRGAVGGRKGIAPVRGIAGEGDRAAPRGGVSCPVRGIDTPGATPLAPSGPVTGMEN